MNRYEQWDIVSSVGLTALVVAAGRSVDTHRRDGLISDPYAERFVAAAEPPTPLPTRPVTPRSDSEDELWQMMSGYMGVRTRFFDEFFDAAGRAGIRQAVILAAGLDARAQRLEWAPGTTLFEVDQPAVLAFKDEVLGEAPGGGRPRCDRRTVAVDLRDDWTGALGGAGFDPSAPTAWLAEGLLPYLPAEAQEALLEAVDERGGLRHRDPLRDRPLRSPGVILWPRAGHDLPVGRFPWGARGAYGRRVRPPERPGDHDHERRSRRHRPAPRPRQRQLVGRHGPGARPRRGGLRRRRAREPHRRRVEGGRDAERADESRRRLCAGHDAQGRRGDRLRRGAARRREAPLLGRRRPRRAPAPGVGVPRRDGARATTSRCCWSGRSASRGGWPAPTSTGRSTACAGTSRRSRGCSPATSRRPAKRAPLTGPV